LTITPSNKQADACLRLFATRVDTHPGDEWLENRQADFNLWASGIKATATGRSSLDYRVRCWPETSKAICSYLDGIRDLLHDYPEQVDHSVNPAQSASEADAADDDVANEIRISSRSILNGLVRISSKIRKVGTGYRFKSADSTFEANRSLSGELRDLESLLNIVIFRARGGHDRQGDAAQQLVEFESSNAATTSELAEPHSLLQTTVPVRLIRANLVRRNRIIYAQRTVGKKTTAADEDIQPKEVEPTRKAVKPDRTVSESQTPQATDGLTATSGGSKKQPRSEAPSAPATKTATEIGSKYNEGLVLGDRNTASVLTRATLTGIAHEYPPCPKPTPDGLIQCPYCYNTISGDYAKDRSRWR